MAQNTNIASRITQFNHLRIPLEDVLQATNNFDTKNVIGQGDLGRVYKGKLLRSGKWVKIAARRLDSKRKQGIEFLTEISALSSLEHENIVSFIGFCDEKGEKVIINKHAAKGSLSMYLRKPALTWIQRLKICVGVARALSYIHKGNRRGYCIIHRNINSSTILLDNHFDAKLSGFEYSINHSVHRMEEVLLSAAIGTTGYVDPEIEKTGGVTHKSDIYSFGVVLWEILCWRKAFIPDEFDSFLAPLAKFHYENKTLHDISQHSPIMSLKSFSFFSNVAYSCLKDERVQRPDMNTVVYQLENAFKLQLPNESLYLQRKNLEHLIFGLSDMKIRLADIVLATENFSEAYRIGNTSFYDLYRAELDYFDKENFSTLEEKSKGKLPKRRNTVIIKRIRPEKGKRGEEVFFTEFGVLTSCKHHSIVTLLGFCDEGFEMILVVENVSNGLLDNYLVNIKDEPNLTWVKRLQVCLDVAYGLNYLHYEMEDQKTVINRNIKSGIIALDDNWRAKIVDFGYSLFVPPNQNDDSVNLYSIAGTKGYMDPYYKKSCRLQRESDVYSFGVVLFEILCGRVADDPIYTKESDEGLAFVAQRCFSEGTVKDMIDPLIKEENSDNNFNSTEGPLKDSLDIFVKIAHRCLRETQYLRPTMKAVIKELEKALSFQKKGYYQQEDVEEPVAEDKKVLEMKLRENLERSKNALESPPRNYQKDFLVTMLRRKKLGHLKFLRSHLKIRLANIMLATNDFSQVYHTGDIGNYDLYRAELGHFNEEDFASVVEEKNKSEQPKRRTTVIIKRMRPMEVSQAEELLCTEIEMHAACGSHGNIVTLLGFCDEGSEKIIVVEDVWNVSLDHYLVNIKGMPILGWAKRLRLCHDVARALEHVHFTMGKKMVVMNSDIKRRSIALSDDWRARIFNFGNSSLMPSNLDEKSSTLRTQSDVYSFGVTLFEILCGRLANDPIYTKENDKGLADVAQRCFHEGTLMKMIDPIIMGESTNKSIISTERPNKDSLDVFVKIAYQCLAQSQDKQPTMKDVVKELDKALSFQEQEIYQSADQLFAERRKKLELKLRENIERSKNAVESPSWNSQKWNILKHLSIRMSDIMLATNNFNFSNQTHYKSDTIYDSYKGELELFNKEHNSGVEEKNKSELPKRRTTVDIKRIRHTKDKEVEKLFFKELEMLTTCKHRNIVTLHGVCEEDSEKILVLEPFANGYLSSYFEEIKNKPILTWAKRLKICLDVAHGLNYLHHEMEDNRIVINCNIRSNTIALDENWGAKIVDFAYSVFLPPNQDDDALYHGKIINGDQGFTDPEYMDTGKLKRESDVYSFGIVLLSSFCGRVDKLLGGLAHYKGKEAVMEKIDPILKEEIGDSNFSLNRGPNKRSVEAFLKIACQCVEMTQDKRPTMKVVVEELEKALFLQENNKDNNLMISYEVIKVATENFHDCVGGGGFGNVYIGKLPEGDGFRTIVAKKLDTSGGQGEQQFRNELQILFEYRHENIIPLVGYCDEKDAKIIVYEYALKGSLYGYLRDVGLTWMRRLKICIDVATALDFLHTGVGTQATVIHRDIKTENILLTDDWNAMLADFGLSLRSVINQETDYVIDRACGTEGYVDPLYLKSGFLTKESDIYSFGVVLIEILCGRSMFVRPKRGGVFLPSFIKHNFEKEKLDEVVFKKIKAEIVPEALTTFQRIACKCLHHNREERPKAKEVVEQLKKALELQMSTGDRASTKTSTDYQLQN